MLVVRCGVAATGLGDEPAVLLGQGELWLAGLLTELCLGVAIRVWICLRDSKVDPDDVEFCITADCFRMLYLHL